ncbi:helix-turn-helix transcriptional regulator [Holophaga foetida]|uniref:helix-turn-helix transcriptional regulator n=1 Tax=Holophaga foetida TaxID=35839 RepID=UPI00130D9726|nr:WYL domain-containing protein [Holophaga foetida]
MRALLMALRETGSLGMLKEDLRRILAARADTVRSVLQEDPRRKAKALDKKVERCLASLERDKAVIERRKEASSRKIRFVLTQGPEWDEHISGDARLALKLAGMTLSQTGTRLWHEKLEVIEQFANRHMTDRDRRLFHQLDSAVKVYGGVEDPCESTLEAVLVPLLQAIETKRMVRVEYQSPGAVNTFLMDVSPHSLTHDLFAGGAYLLVWDPKGDSPKQLRLNRISEVEILKDRAKFPDKWRMKNAVDYQIGAWCSGDDPFEVVVRIWGASWIKSLEEAPPALPGFLPAREEEGSLLVRFKANCEEGPIRWILQFGACAQVLAPLALRQRVREELEETLKGYRD